MNISELVPSTEHKLLFQYKHLFLAPKVSGCYVLTTYDDKILYIGRTGNLHSRFKQHLANPEKVNPTSEGKAIWFHFRRVAEIEIEKIERTWMQRHLCKYGCLPILNKVNSSIL